MDQITNKKSINGISTNIQKIKKNNEKVKIIIQYKTKELLPDKKYLYTYKI
jgi:hypothetical protein